MDFSNVISLNNPPIKQVSAGLMFEPAFKSFDDIQLFYKNSKLKELFPKQETNKTMAVLMDKEPRITQDVMKFLKLTNDKNLKELYIDPSRILYIDGDKYSNFDTFSSALYDIVDIFLGSIKELKIKEVGLRYINSFSLSQDKLGKVFYVCPQINLTNDGNPNNPYAYMSNNLTISSIVDVKNKNLSAIVKNMTNLKPNTPLLNIEFDIDTNMCKEYTLVKSEDLKKDFLELKRFKNQIFFSNFENAYEIEEFK